MCLEIYELDPAKSISPPELARVKAELDFCTDIKMLLMVEKGIRGGICHSIYQNLKANCKYMKHYDKISNPHTFNIGM